MCASEDSRILYVRQSLGKDWTIQLYRLDGPDIYLESNANMFVLTSSRYHGVFGIFPHATWSESRDSQYFLHNSKAKESLDELINNYWRFQMALPISTVGEQDVS